MRKVCTIKYFLDNQDKKQIRKQLIDLGLTEKEFAEKIGISVTYLSLILNGKRAITDTLVSKIFNL